MNVSELLKKNAQRMRTLYGGDDQAARYTNLVEEFRARFGREPAMFVSAPGRTEVVGNHTDHNRGCVLAGSVNLDTLAVVAGRTDDTVTLYSNGYSEPFRVDLSDLHVRNAERETSLSLIRGVAARLKELGYAIGGFDACVTSRVFKGSGLSSSAAFEVLLVGVFDALYNGWTIDPKLNACISQYAENVYFGKPSGLEDQMASAVGGLVEIDFGPEEAKVDALGYDFSKKGYHVCVVAAGGDHGNLTADYAAIPGEMGAVARAMGKEFLSQVTLEELMEALPGLKNRVPDRALLRAFHFVDETVRSVRAAEALRRDDLPAFLEVVRASGESSWMLLQNLYVPTGENEEMPLALEMSRRILGERGAWRIHGGGFAGTILAFVPEDLLEKYKTTMDAVFGSGAVTALRIRPEGCVCIQ